MALKLALVLLFALPGAPSIYYGTEAGLSGGEEPACREAFPWRAPPADLSGFIGSLAHMRRAGAAWGGRPLADPGGSGWSGKAAYQQKPFPGVGNTW